MSPLDGSLGAVVVDESGMVAAFGESLAQIGLERQHLGRPWWDVASQLGRISPDPSSEDSDGRDAYHLACNGDVYELTLHRQVCAKGASPHSCIVVDRVTDRDTLSRQSLRLDKQATLAGLVAGIAHEINNPLTYISGWLQMMLADAEAEDSEDASTLQMLTQEADRVAKIVSNLLSYSRPAPPTVKLVKVDGLINEVVELVEYQLRNRRIQVTRQFQSDAPKVAVDPSSLKQVLLNLIINAKQAMPDGGRLEMTTEADDERVQIRIADTGVGIRPELLPRVFERGFTTKDEDGGSGLGLHVCREVIEGHGGAIDVESEIESGTVFTIRLPLRRAQDEESQPVRQWIQSHQEALVT